MKSSLKSMIVLILTALLAVFLTACGGGKNNSNGGDKDNGKGGDIGSDSKIIIAWTDLRSGHGEIFARIFNNDGTFLHDEFRVNQFTDYSPGEAAEDPAIVVDSNGRIIITWEDPRYGADMVFARIFDNSGKPLTDDFRVDQYPNRGSDPSIAIDGNDHFIITWEETRLDQASENDDVFARIFDSNGNPLTDEFRVDQDTGVSDSGEPIIDVSF